MLSLTDISCEVHMERGSTRQGRDESTDERASRVAVEHGRCVLDRQTQGRIIDVAETESTGEVGSEGSAGSERCARGLTVMISLLSSEVCTARTTAKPLVV